MKAILLVAHGSKSEEAKKILEKIVLEFKKETYEIVESCFLGISSPKIPEALESLHKKGVKEIIVVPYFLFPGNHALKDIPTIVKENAEKFNFLSIQIAKPIGYDKRLIEILIERTQNDLLSI